MAVDGLRGAGPCVKEGAGERGRPAAGRALPEEAVPEEAVVVALAGQRRAVDEERQLRVGHSAAGGAV
ncbi:hypothetical protein [Streptomyces sp. B1I3]|uniref:hypothetical protein n=1 Tax=Streptomyces sp. B1I3 TaxID=3042264 RepID=UPI002785C861|nr:hypothetical protein [Streptomyces sp. B1I3]MDQ0796491.1 hypothetical protein [Streptomyces sp. B1I3]